jgi:hypothetical protein
MKTETDQDPLTRMIGAMMAGKTDEFRAARREIAMAEHSRMTDAEIEAVRETTPSWMRKLSDAELDGLIDATIDDEDVDAFLALVANNKTLNDADRAEIHDSRNWD